MRQPQTVRFVYRRSKLSPFCQFLYHSSLLPDIIPWLTCTATNGGVKAFVTPQLFGAKIRFAATDGPVGAAVLLEWAPATLPWSMLSDG